MRLAPVLSVDSDTGAQFYVPDITPRTYTKFYVGSPYQTEMSGAKWSYRITARLCGRGVFKVKMLPGCQSSVPAEWSVFTQPARWTAC